MSNTTGDQSNAEEGDLYDDLDETRASRPAAASATVTATAKPSKTSFHTHEDGAVQSRPWKGANVNDAEVATLRERIVALERENRILKRNIGTLFRTARNEIKRKDNQINNLMVMKASSSSS